MIEYVLKKGFEKWLLLLLALFISHFSFLFYFHYDFLNGRICVNWGTNK